MKPRDVQDRAGRHTKRHKALHSYSRRQAGATPNEEKAVPDTVQFTPELTTTWQEALSLGTLVPVRFNSHSTIVRKR